MPLFKVSEAEPDVITDIFFCLLLQTLSRRGLCCKIRVNKWTFRMWCNARKPLSGEGRHSSGESARRQLVWFQSRLHCYVPASFLNIGQTGIWVRDRWGITRQAVDYFDHSVYCSKEYSRFLKTYFYQFVSTLSKVVWNLFGLNFRQHLTADSK